MPAAVVTLSTFPRFHSGERETSRRARYNDKILQLYEKGDLHSLMSLARPAAVAVQAKRINILRAFWKAKNGIASHVLVRKHERYFKDESEVFGNATLTRSQTWLSMVETVPGSYNMVFNQRTSERPGWGRRTYLSSVAKVIRPNITE
ncbi:MAG: hypothetical protein HY053_07495, partial [Proteobacteria bacterium]|nr:hypothetical protein [Pseudomonadota bacterium]